MNKVGKLTGDNYYDNVIVILYFDMFPTCSDTEIDPCFLNVSFNKVWHANVPICLTSLGHICS
jgi:hypothetical protein